MNHRFWLAILVVAAQAGSLHAGTLTDEFDASHDYLVSGTAGTIWAGWQASAPAVVGTLDANTSNAGALTITSSNGYWESAVANGPLLYLNVSGDFVAELEIRSSDGLLFHDKGIMARLADVGAAGAGEDYIATRYFHPNPSGGIISLRDTDNGVSTNYDAATLRRFMQLERSGDTFHYRSKVNAGDPWQLHRSQSRADLAGFTLQVGIWQATFSANTGAAQFERFTITGPNVNPPTVTPTLTPSSTPTASPTRTGTPTSSPTATPTLTGTPTASPTATPTSSATPTSIPTIPPTATPTAGPSATPTPVPPIPAAGPAGLAMLALVLSLALSRRRPWRSDRTA